MNILRTFFEINREVVFFVYGLTFFLMGFSVALQSRHYSRLELARSLSWLAGFGFTHAFQEWGDVFIPIQANLFSEPVIQLLRTLQLVLLAVSFVCLIEFGIVLISPSGRARWLHGLAAGLLLGWFFLTFWVFLPISSDLTAWHHLSNAFARYFIGFPGGGSRPTAFTAKPINISNGSMSLRSLETYVLQKSPLFFTQFLGG